MAHVALGLHLSGTPELLDDALPVLRRTVEHFEAAVEQPWSLERTGDTAAPGPYADAPLAAALRRRGA